MTLAMKVLGGTRVLIGIGAWFAPGATARVFGIDPARSDRFTSRLFGSRELTLAAGLHAAPPGALAGLDERRRGNLSTRATILGPVGAIGFVALGLLVARDARSQAA